MEKKKRLGHGTYEGILEEKKMQNSASVGGRREKEERKQMRNREIEMYLVSARLKSLTQLLWRKRSLSGKVSQSEKPEVVTNLQGL